MSFTRGLAVMLPVVVLIGWMSQVASPAPWDNLLTLRRVEADPDKPYRLTKENGPWMIMACSFSGEQAEQQARELVLELRKRYKLEAYGYKKAFELDDETYGLGVNQYGEPLKMLKMRYRRGSEFDEVAVLVGNYTSVDDPQAQETLRKLKYFRPDCLELKKGKPTARSLAGWRLIQKRILAPGNEKKQKGPMGHAMITTNPLLPKDYFVPQGLDPVVLKANEGVKNCLLDCPGRYTVQVATFRGRMTIDQGEIAAIEHGRRKMKSELVDAAEKAHELTKALREKGYEAYEFHDRYASIVTVGSFDWLSQRTPDGQARLNPAIQKVLDRFGPKQTNLGGQTGGLVQQTLIGIPFDLKPIVVHVPKRSLSARYTREVTGLF